MPNKFFLPHFSIYNRQRGSGIGALAAGIGRVALLFAKKSFTPGKKHWEGIAYAKCS